MNSTLFCLRLGSATPEVDEEAAVLSKLVAKPLCAFRPLLEYGLELGAKEQMLEMMLGRRDRENSGREDLRRYIPLTAGFVYEGGWE